MPSGLVLSKSAQMRAKRAAGMEVGDIARLFGVSYHQAYAACVTHRGSKDMVIEPAAPFDAAIENEDLSALTWEDLFKIIETDAKKRHEKIRRRLATAEADRRDPSGDWMDRAQEWSQANGSRGRA